ncbi:MAG: YfhO family protein, partial [Chloroflexota bacterium]
PAIAFGIAAAQVLPLVELGFFSFRGPGVTYQFATSYSMPVHNLVNLLFPYFFRYTNFFYWSLWSEWETTLYVGIGPLVLAGVAVIFVRNRMVLFFAAAATASVLLAFGSYSPYPLYEQLWHLPGFSSLRVPGRFGMLATLSVAALAAYGVDWLSRTLRPVDAAPKGASRWRRLSRLVGVNGFALYLVGLLAAIAGVLWWLASFRIWIEREPWAVKRLVEASYLSLRNDRPWLTSDMVLSFLNYTLDPTNPKTATSLALMLGVFLLLFCWFAFRRLWRGWATLMVVLVAADMLLFAVDFHPTVHINQLSSPESATRWLLSQNGDGMTRVYTPREIRKTEPNKLLPYQISDIAGYSSLETVRHQQYMSKLNEFDKTLLDLYNVRFVVLPKRSPALPSYEYTGYHPNRPLADGPRGNPGAHVTFYLDPPMKADEVAFISNLRSADGIPQDAEVADIVVVDDRGERSSLKVKAGRDTGEWAWDRPDVTPHVAHKKPRVADRVWASDSEGRNYQANLYYGRLPLDRTRTVSRVEFHYTYPKGAVRLYGMMLWEKPTTAHQLLSSNRFVPRYEDDEVQILENPSRLPRAYLVPTARVVKRWEVLDLMANGDFDPTKTVLLETGDGAAPKPLPIPDTGVPDPKAVEGWLQGNPDGSPGTAEIAKHESTEVEIRTSSRRNAVLFLSDSYYPGWKALVDGQPAQLYRADYLFRAVLVPEGEHRVRFVFRPDSFALGTDISLFTLWGLLIFWFGMVAGVPMGRMARQRMKMWRARVYN